MMKWLWRHPSFKQSHLRLVFSGFKKCQPHRLPRKTRRLITRVTPFTTGDICGSNVQYCNYISYLVVSIDSTPLKNMKVSCDYSSQHMESHKIPWFQSPPSSGHVMPQTVCESFPFHPQELKIVSPVLRNPKKILVMISTQ